MIKSDINSLFLFLLSRLNNVHIVFIHLGFCNHFIFHLSVSGILLQTTVYAPLTRNNLDYLWPKFWYFCHTFSRSTDVHIMILTTVANQPLF